MRVLFVDHEDSFSYNVVQALGQAGMDVHVIHWRATSPVEALSYDLVVLSPGPGHPREYPPTLRLIRHLIGRVPLWGVCLGHQALAVALGGSLGTARTILHGKTTWLHHTGEGPFTGLPSPYRVMRYNSLVIRKLPGGFRVLGRDPEGDILAIWDPSRGILGVQYHPESVLSEHTAVFFRQVRVWAERWKSRSGQPASTPSGP